MDSVIHQSKQPCLGSADRNWTKRHKYLDLADNLIHPVTLLLPGGFYSDTLGYVAQSCKRCPNGSYVAYDKKPGKSVLDCKSCPLGKQLKHDPQVLIL